MAFSGVKYSQVPTEDGHKIDFSSPFTYGFNKGNPAEGFTYNRGTNRYEDEGTAPPSCFAQCIHVLVTCLCYLLLVLTCPFSACLAIKVVKNYERLLVFRLGRQQPLKGPGMVFILPCIDRCRRIDMRQRAFNVPPQTAYTEDGGAISVGADVYYRIYDAILAETAVKDLIGSLRVVALTTVHNVLLKKGLYDIETDRTSLNTALQRELNKSTEIWGVEISRLELSQITILRPPANGPVLLPPSNNGPAHNGPAMSPQVQTVFQMAQHFLQQASMGNKGARTEQDRSMVAVPIPESSGTMSADFGLSPRDLLSAVKLLLDESIVEQVGAIYQFELEGEDGGTFYLDLKNGGGDAGIGPPPNEEADVVMTMSVTDMQQLFSGELRPFQAYSSGRLHVEGSLRVATRLEDVVSRLKTS
ncbi:PREDICTED: stomatin-like protein 1 [Branchiostoma belcheri]|uniref:Podocin n=1 Tax=Branchiostoma belcheri TaxID=7741 RepID=A0A6P5ANT3_BRABE|nr:PREDICTED: stomatin-like protein 1 [Branchiostoma belcheri]